MIKDRLKRRREKKLQETISYVSRLQRLLEHDGPVPFRGMMKTEFDVNLRKIERLKRKLG